MPFNSSDFFLPPINLHVGGCSWRNSSNFASRTPVQDNFCSVGSPKLLFRQSHTSWKDGGGKPQVSSDFVWPSLPLRHGEQDLGEGTAGLLKGAGTIIFLIPLSVIAERCCLLWILRNENFCDTSSYGHWQLELLRWRRITAEGEVTHERTD